MTWNGQERRKYHRANFACKLHILGAVGTLELHTEDISAGGLRVTLCREMPAGTLVELKIFLTAGKVVECKGRIAWMVKAPDNVDRYSEIFTTGIEFDDINDKDRQFICDLVEQVELTKAK
jgi:hypothetical protein